MELSTPNRFSGRIKAITLANVMAEVVIETSSGEIVSVLPRSIVVKQGYAVGDSIIAFVNPADVMLARP